MGVADHSRGRQHRGNDQERSCLNAASQTNCDQANCPEEEGEERPGEPEVPKPRHRGRGWRDVEAQPLSDDSELIHEPVHQPLDGDEEEHGDGEQHGAGHPLPELAVVPAVQEEHLGRPVGEAQVAVAQKPDHEEQNPEDSSHDRDDRLPVPFGNPVRDPVRGRVEVPGEPVLEARIEHRVHPAHEALVEVVGRLDALRSFIQKVLEQADLAPSILLEGTLDESRSQAPLGHGAVDQAPEDPAFLLGQGVLEGLGLGRIDRRRGAGSGHEDLDQRATAARADPKTRLLSDCLPVSLIDAILLGRTDNRLLRRLGIAHIDRGHLGVGQLESSGPLQELGTLACGVKAHGGRLDPVLVRSQRLLGLGIAAGLDLDLVGHLLGEVQPGLGTTDDDRLEDLGEVRLEDRPDGADLAEGRPDRLLEGSGRGSGTGDDAPLGRLRHI